MYILHIAVLLASLCCGFTSRQALGSSCKGTGTCETKGTCPNDVIGKCCGGLDCCDCQQEESICGTGNQGTCIANGACAGSTVSGRCCDGLECCTCSGLDTPCGSENQGVCASECDGLTISGECCGGLTCCQPCPVTCGSGGIGNCVNEDTCSSTIIGDCCSGYECCNSDTNSAAK